MPAHDSRAILPEPTADLKRLSRRLAARIHARIEAVGPLPFPDYMEMALYEPGLGYYSAGLRKFGRDGDFVTAPELGGVFAACLARQVEEVAASLGTYSVLEIGAGNGSLAADLLEALDGRPPDRYCILERSAHLRQEQRETIGRRAPTALDRVEWLDHPPEAAWQGVLIANEVLDALPVERFCLARGGLEQLRVRAAGEGFAWHPVEASQGFREALWAAVGEDLEGLPEDYCSEFNPHLRPWLETVTESLSRGCALFIDYGYVRREYYRPERRAGTLICHYRHRALDDPFRWPGLQDISSFVDFSALAEAGRSIGLDCAGYTNQAMFLFGCGLADIMEGSTALPEAERLNLMSEVRELTLPAAMGEKFQVMALARGIGEPLRGFSELDLRYRL